MKTALQNNILETFKNLNQALAGFSQEEFNTVPFKDSWTAGQVTQHILLSGSGYPELFAGKTQKTLRKYDEYEKQLEALFLDFTTKMNAPDFLQPEFKNYDKNSLILALRNLESDYMQAIETYDLTLTCLDFEVPGFEKFTIYEWITFALVHTQRHTNQLNTILRYLTK